MRRTWSASGGKSAAKMDTREFPRVLPNIKGGQHMNIKHAQYMLTVLQEGSITNAARKLYISEGTEKV